MADSLPPVPYKTPLSDRAGFVSEPWKKWFRLLMIRIGGEGSVDSNGVLQGTTLTLSERVAELEKQMDRVGQGQGGI